MKIPSLKYGKMKNGKLYENSTMPEGGTKFICARTVMSGINEKQ